MLNEWIQKSTLAHAVAILGALAGACNTWLLLTMNALVYYSPNELLRYLLYGAATSVLLILLLLALRRWKAAAAVGSVYLILAATWFVWSAL